MNSDFKKIVKWGALAIFFTFIIIYAFFRSRSLIFGVKIKNLNLNGLPAQSGEKLEDNVTKITGNAKNATKLTLNGREISIDKKGNFDESIALLSGYNIISIEAEDKFGHKDEKNYQLIH